MATHIKHLITEFLESKEREFSTQDNMNKIIRKVFDKNTQKQIQLKQLTKDKVVLYSGSSSLSYIINLKKEELLREIKKDFPNITKIQIEQN